jgi:hypothetical protein
MKEKALRILQLFNELNILLKKGTLADGDSTIYLCKKIDYANHIMVNLLDEPNRAEIKWQEELKELKNFYERLFHFRVGLDSVFIWRDDFEERKKENERLERVKQEINEIFNSIT